MLPPRSVWLTSDSQVRHWREMVGGGRSGAPLRARWPGVENAPHVAPFYGLLGLRFPSPYLAHGVLSAEPDGLRFRSTPPRLWGNRVADLRDGLDWAVPLASLVAVESVVVASPAGARHDLAMARVRTAEAGWPGDFHVASAAAKFSPERARALTGVLPAELSALAAGRGWAARDAQPA